MKRTIVVAALLALTSSGAAAQVAGAGATDGLTAYGFQPGDWQFTLSGTGSNDNDFETGNFGLSAGLSYFLTGGIELGLRQDVTFADTGDENAWNGITRVGAYYNFDVGRLRPFVGASIGYVYGDNVNETGIIGPEAGLKYFVNPTTFVYGQTAYQWFFEDNDDIEDNFDDASWTHTVGIGFRF